MTAVDAFAARDVRRAPTDAASMPLALRALVVFALALGLGAALRFYLSRGSLWEDELIAITHANEPLPRFFVEMLRNDIHPPLYFLQLDGWLALGNDSDRWALGNSLAWAAISLAVVFFVARRVHGVRAGWFAAALFAVLPSFVWSAGTLRMYAMLPACVVAVYYANRRWFESRRTGWLVACLVGEVLLAYVHAVEFFFVAFIVAGAFAEAWQRGLLRSTSGSFARSLPAWLVVQVLFGIAALPIAASALLRGSDASAPGSIASMLTIGGALVAGWRTSGIEALRLGGTVVFAILVVAGIANRDSRARTLAIPVAALVVATVIALALKPIYKQPVFAANLLPFVVLGAAAAARRARVAALAVGGCIVVLAIAALPLVPALRQGEAYAPAALAVRDAATSGDVVVVPNVSVYWGIARYAVGPRWGRPLSIMPPPNAQWKSLGDRLARWPGIDPWQIGLAPDRQDVERDGVRYVIGGDALEATAQRRARLGRHARSIRVRRPDRSALRAVDGRRTARRSVTASCSCAASTGRTSDEPGRRRGERLRPRAGRDEGSAAVDPDLPSRAADSATRCCRASRTRSRSKRGCAGSLRRFA